MLWKDEPYVKEPHALYEIMSELTEPQLKCLLFIIRVTFGFQKYRDPVPISIDEFMNGMLKSDRSRHNFKTGLSRPAVAKALKFLEQKQIICAVEHASIGTARATRSYFLPMEPEDIETGFPSDGNGVSIRSKRGFHPTSGIKKRSKEEDTSLDTNVSKEVLRNVSSAAKNKKKQQEERSTRSRSRSQRDVFNEKMEQTFHEATNIPIPQRKTAKAAKAAGARWNVPLWNMYLLFRPEEERQGNDKMQYDKPSLERTCDLIRKSVDHMREGRLTISTPQSIESVANHIFATEYSGGVTSAEFFDQFYRN